MLPYQSQPNGPESQQVPTHLPLRLRYNPLLLLLGLKTHLRLRFTTQSKVRVLYLHPRVVNRGNWAKVAMTWRLPIYLMDKNLL